MKKFQLFYPVSRLFNFRYIYIKTRKAVNLARIRSVVFDGGGVLNPGLLPLKIIVVLIEELKGLDDDCIKHEFSSRKNG